MFNTSVAVTLLRYVLTLAGGAIVAKGYAGDSVVQMGIGVILGAVNGAIGAKSSTDDAKLKAAARLPDVDSVVKTDGSVLFERGSGNVMTSFPKSDANNSRMTDNDR